MRERIRSIFSTFDNITTVGEAENGIEELNLIREKESGMAIPDIHAPEIIGRDTEKYKVSE